MPECRLAHLHPPTTTIRRTLVVCDGPPSSVHTESFVCADTGSAGDTRCQVIVRVISTVFALSALVQSLESSWVQSQDKTLLCSRLRGIIPLYRTADKSVSTVRPQHQHPTRP